MYRMDKGPHIVEKGVYLMSAASLKVALLQINSLVGDVWGNFAKIEKLMRAQARNADLFVTPELVLLGYPPGDLLSFPQLIEEETRAVLRLQELSKELGVALLLGHTEKSSPQSFAPFYNSATLFDSGVWVGTQRKQRLPNYDIFDERRFFEPWPELRPQGLLKCRGHNVALQICEDGWDVISAFGAQNFRSYSKSSNPIESLTEAPNFVVNMSASPWTISKRQRRELNFCQLAKELSLPVLYVNSVGAHDDLIFDGASFMADAEGALVQQAASFSEDCLVVDVSNTKVRKVLPIYNEWEELRAALVLGLGDYVRKSGFQKVLLGLSGGIDSAVCAALAVEALGKDHVTGVSLPSVLTSDFSKQQARALAQNLGIEFREYSIAQPVEAHQKTLGLKSAGLGYENLQSRNRGLMLMSLSNEWGALLVSTGNKSEMAMGYSTLYGDLCGAICPLGDVYKTEVYGLAHYMNARAKKLGVQAPIPLETILRVPTAELAPNQQDSDSLPEYAMLDVLLKCWIEHQAVLSNSSKEWRAFLKIEEGSAKDLPVLWKKFHTNEFKRFQAPVVLKAHARAFGSGWKMPLAKKMDWKEFGPA